MSKDIITIIFNKKRINAMSIIYYINKSKILLNLIDWFLFKNKLNSLGDIITLLTSRNFYSDQKYAENYKMSNKILDPNLFVEKILARQTYQPSQRKYHQNWAIPWRQRGLILTSKSHTITQLSRAQERRLLITTGF